MFQRDAWSADHLPKVMETLGKVQACWAARSPRARADGLLKLADILASRREHLANGISREVGKRTTECLAEVEKSEKLIRYYAELAPTLLEPQPVSTQASHSCVAFEPLGTVLAIMPWNFPVWQVLRFAVPALMAGNACLVKPAPNVAQSSQLLLDCIQAAGLDCLDMAWIEHGQVEQAISLSAAVAFTGSAETGKLIASLAGRHLKKTVLELGGSNPFIVLADADIAAAAEDAANARFRDAGQSCNAAKRLILVPEIADPFLRSFCQAAQALQCGDPQDPATTLAPLARADLRQHLQAQVNDALQQGARLIMGGEIPTGAGFHYPATVLDHVNDQCRVYHEEVFGPVISVLRASNETDAIRLANDTPFGLGASIYSQDNVRAWQLARQIQCGSVFINRHTSSDLRLPFGGIKASGYGRELSSFGLYEFVNVKSYWQK